MTTKKRCPTFCWRSAFIHPTGVTTSSTSSNYATIQIQPVLSRLPGISDVRMFGQRDYSMRIWLDPDKLAGRVG